MHTTHVAVTLSLYTLIPTVYRPLMESAVSGFGHWIHIRKSSKSFTEGHVCYTWVLCKTDKEGFQTDGQHLSSSSMTHQQQSHGDVRVHIRVDSAPPCQNSEAIRPSGKCKGNCQCRQTRLGIVMMRKT